ncbi:MAG: 4-hydroxythreonine-4-phosphate dehydrogenase PdxA [Bacteroidota bacterium]
MAKPIIGISQGDPNGVGLEVIIKSLQHDYIFDYCIPVVYCNPKSMNFTKKTLGTDKPNYNLIKDVSEIKQRQVNVIASSQEPFEVQYGTPSETAGKEALMAIDRMLADAQSGKIHAMVTAPVDKSTVKTEAGFSGHTGYITKYFGVENSLMILANEDIRVGLVTEHVAVSKVAQHITIDNILNKLRVANQSLKRDFGIVKPRIAVLGLNPHNGDNGTLGTEEKDIIKPAIKQATEEGIFCFGPYSADGFFGIHTYSQFDLVLAMYHDQGLIPFKSIAFDDGINYTAGLPVIRTSPDHGTGYDIAGKNIASFESFSNALFFAIKTYHQQNETDELKSNPLLFSELKRERFRLEQA